MSSKMQLQKMTIKDIANELLISERTAKRISSDIKEHYNTKILVREHLICYLGLK